MGEIKVEVSFNEVEIQKENSGLITIWICKDGERMLFYKTCLFLENGQSLNVKGIEGNIRIDTLFNRDRN